MASTAEKLNEVYPHTQIPEDYFSTRYSNKILIHFTTLQVMSFAAYDYETKSWVGENYT